MPSDMRRIRLFLIVVAFGSLVIGCTDREVTEAPDVSTRQPDWVETVYPEPGAATLGVPAAVEVDHAMTSGDEDVRLIIDGTDVTTYAVLGAGKLRYESGDGPVVLDDGEHSAEVQLVTLPAEGVDYRVIDSFRWEFRIG